MAFYNQVKYTYSVAEYLSRLNFRLAAYNKLGLYSHDILMEDAVVQEAINRLPLKVRDEVEWRKMRAFHLSLKKINLPKDMWISYEEDQEKGKYLQPYIDEVLAEYKEKKQWMAK